MSGREDSYSPILDADLAPFVKEANGLLARIRWSPEMSGDERIRLAQRGWPDSVVKSGQVQSALPDMFKILDQDALILSKTTNTVLEVLRDGAAIGLYVQDDVSKRVGLETMEQSDRLAGGRMGTATRHRKMMLSATQLFTLSYYTLWNLRDFQEGSRTPMHRPFPGLAELVHDHLHDGQASVYRSVMHYYAQMISPENGMISGSEELVDATVQYFQAVMDKLKEYIIPGLQDGDLFKEVRYSLEGSGFTISGFDLDYAGVKAETTELKEVLWSDIIGNHIAKSRLRRSVDLMFLQDKTSGENPVMNFGGVANVVLIQGKPGGGKTMILGGVGTQALKRSKETGLPVRILIYPRNLVSKYQGVSADKVAAFWKMTNDPEYITIVLMDEAEQLIPERDNDRASSGAKAGTNGFLVATEGADQEDVGRRLIIVATNHAHQIDSAARSRAKEKIEVNGAETPNDYMDFINLMIKLQDKAFKSFLTLDLPKQYTFMADQGKAPDLDASKDESPIISGLQKICSTVEQSFLRDQYDFYGQLFYQFQRANPAFSLRDLRNIFEATIFEMAQFSIPETFFSPESAEYHPLSLEEKEEVLRGRLETHLKENNVAFADALFKNAIRQMTEIEKIGQIEFNRDVQRTVKGLKVRAAAVAEAQRLGIPV